MSNFMQRFYHEFIILFEIFLNAFLPLGRIFLQENMINKILIYIPIDFTVLGNRFKSEKYSILNYE